MSRTQINLFFEILAERDYDRARIMMEGSTELQGSCDYTPNKKFIYDRCFDAAGGRCKLCPQEAQ